jgi:methylphosphotriester-DNA--protein-cysteine methyltransferase
MLYFDDETRWSAVVARDAAADGQFIYAVRTTKIFCRPTCKARLARRSNVEFFDNADQAQAAGYRSCKRCQPLLERYRPEADKVAKACNLLDSLPQNAPLPGLDRLAKEAGLTKHHFHRLFKRETGMTPREYAIAKRRESQSDTTESASMTPFTPVTNEIASPLVFQDDSFGSMDMFPNLNFPMFEDDFKLPSSQEIRNVIVHYNIVNTTCGLLLLAFQDRQICKLELGSSQAELMDRLECSYPTICYFHSPISHASPQDALIFQRETLLTVDRLENPSQDILDLPLTVRPTDLDVPL